MKNNKKQLIIRSLSSISSCFTGNINGCGGGLKPLLKVRILSATGEPLFENSVRTLSRARTETHFVTRVVNYVGYVIDHVELRRFSQFSWLYPRKHKRFKTSEICWILHYSWKAYWLQGYTWLTRLNYIYLYTHILLNGWSKSQVISPDSFFF